MSCWPLLRLAMPGRVVCRLCRALMWALLAGSLIVGCGGSGSSHNPGRRQPASINRLIARVMNPVDPPATPRARVWQFRDVNFHAVIADAGSPLGFVMFATTRRDVTVTRDSAAIIRALVTEPARFASQRDERHWKAQGSPPVADGTRSLEVLHVPAGTFGFAPQGLPLTVRSIQTM